MTKTKMISMLIAFFSSQVQAAVILNCDTATGQKIQIKEGFAQPKVSVNGKEMFLPPNQVRKTISDGVHLEIRNAVKLKTLHIKYGSEHEIAHSTRIEDGLEMPMNCRVSTDQNGSDEVF